MTCVTCSVFHGYFCRSHLSAYSQDKTYSSFRETVGPKISMKVTFIIVLRKTRQSQRKSRIKFLVNPSLTSFLCNLVQISKLKSIWKQEIKRSLKVCILFQRLFALGNTCSAIQLIASPQPRTQCQIFIKMRKKRRLR